MDDDSDFEGLDEEMDSIRNEHFRDDPDDDDGNWICGPGGPDC